MYFIEQNNNKIGPLTYDQLTGYIIFKDTLIWKSGLESWQKAITFEELKSLIIDEPPLLPEEQALVNRNEKLKSNKRNVLRFLFKSFVWALPITYLYMLYDFDSVKKGFYDKGEFAIYFTLEEKRDVYLYFKNYFLMYFIVLLVFVMIIKLIYSVVKGTNNDEADYQAKNTKNTMKNGISNDAAPYSFKDDKIDDNFNSNSPLKF